MSTRYWAQDRLSRLIPASRVAMKGVLLLLLALAWGCAASDDPTIKLSGVHDLGECSKCWTRRPDRRRSTLGYRSLELSPVLVCRRHDLRSSHQRP